MALTFLNRLPNKRFLSIDGNTRNSQLGAQRREYHGKRVYERLPVDVQVVFDRITPDDLRWAILCRVRIVDSHLLCECKTFNYKDGTGEKRQTTARSIVARAKGLLCTMAGTVCGNQSCINPHHLSQSATRRNGERPFALRENVVADLALPDRVEILNRARKLAKTRTANESTRDLVSALVSELEDSDTWLCYCERVALEEVASIAAVVRDRSYVPPDDDDNPPSVRRLLGLEVDDYTE